ncbi:SDR family NAD(P)-dependent oxidoreductase [Tautonia plasticadhaerens]|nr:SDR family NAD(P)-dependent oxidoreductase [Tautonia plasticadhaerens]
MGTGDDRGGKAVVITGASAGLGAQVARERARRGDRLALVARRADRLGRVADEVRGLGGTAFCLAEDLADPEAPARVVEAAVDRLGGLDVLVNNAGIGLPDYFGRCEPGAIRAQVEVNLTAPMMLARLAMPYLVESRGVIVNIGSAIVGLASPVLGAYGTTKAALSYWSDALRREVRHRGVRVCLVELGPVETEFFEAVGRLGGRERGLLGRPPMGSVYNAMRDRPPGAMTIPVASAARRISALIDAPRARAAVPRRLVWPVRVMGAFFGAFPWLADVSVSAMIRRVEREQAAARSTGPDGGEPAGR